MSIEQSSTSYAIGAKAGLPARAKVRPWTWALGLIALVFVIRLVYLAWLCPYELIGDESYYWEQARHHDLCEDEKGAALPWMIAASCWALGDTELAVRLPAMLSFIVAGWAAGRLAMATYRDDPRREQIGLLAVIVFFLMPAFLANSQISTQDAQLIALWVALSAVGLRLVRRWRAGQSTWGPWLWIWALLGIGTLFKQSIVLFLPSFAVYALIERRHLRWRWGELIAQQLAGVVLFTLLITPMIYWNWQHGWPMVLHTAGHLGLGGDQAGQVNRGNPLSWLGSTIGGILGAFGPGAIALMIWACIVAYKRRADDPQRWSDRFWLMCCAWPSVLFFVGLSFIKPVVPSWPLPSFAPLVVLVAELLVVELLNRRPAQPKPNQTIRQLWTTTVAYGVGAWVVISFPTFLAHLPVVGKLADHAINSRITGFRANADELQSVLDEVGSPDGKPPIIVTRHYMHAGQDCFYLKGHPPVHTAGKYLGKRSTTFDQWDDTRLDNPALYGRPLLLVGSGDVPWEKGLIFDHIQPLRHGRFFLAHNYQGPRPDYPSAIPRK